MKYLDKRMETFRNMKLNLSGQVGIITGAASGIGKEIALRLAKDGASIILADINYDGLTEVLEHIKKEGENHIAVKTDVSIDKDVKNLISEGIKKFGKIDFLFSNAGIVGPYDFDDTSAGDWDKVFDINVKGMFLCSKYVIPYMKDRKYGRIIYTASTNADKPGGYVIAYRASKAAVVMLARSLALYAAPYNITINAVCPGVVLTQIEQNMIKEMIKDKNIKFEEYIENRAKRIPMGRFTKEKDIADIAEFLVSDNASFITGQSIFVNGGEW